MHINLYTLYVILNRFLTNHRRRDRLYVVHSADKLQVTTPNYCEVAEKSNVDIRAPSRALRRENGALPNYLDTSSHDMLPVLFADSFVYLCTGNGTWSLYRQCMEL